jgi:hypothetical protein
VLDCFQPAFWRLTRSAVYVHLYKCYGEECVDQDLSRDAGLLITKCLAFPLGEPRRYGVGMAIRRDESSLTGSNVSEVLCAQRANILRN